MENIEGSIRFLSFIENDKECFDISLRKVRDTASWELGSCSLSLEYVTPGVYIEKCCVTPGEHILTCNNHEDDWSRSVLILRGHHFCNDYVGYKAMIRLNISGKIWRN